MSNGEYTTGEMAKHMAEHSDKPELIQKHVQVHAQRDWIHTFGKRGVGVTAAKLYSEDQMAVSKVILELHAMGFADPDVIGKAALGMTAKFRDYATMKEAVKRFKAGDGFWWFQLCFYRNDQTGQRWAQSFIYNDDGPEERRREPMSADDGWLPRGAVVIALNPLFLHLFSKRDKAN